MVPYRIEPVEWELIYPVQPSTPIGQIRRRRDGFHAKLQDEHLGVYANGDAAAEAIWQRFLEQNTARHAHAAVTHGSRERH